MTNKKYNSFGLAPIKAEGGPIPYAASLSDGPSTDDSTYVERRVPRALEETAHKLIDRLLENNGYPDDY